MKFKPREYQKIIIEHIQKTPRCAIWAGMGMGKTAAVLKALSILSLVEDVFPTLVLAPLRVARTTWVDEVKKWSDFQQLTIQVIDGCIAQRQGKAATKADIYTVNYENIPWLVDFYGKDWPFKTIIADESTRLKGFRLRQGTKRARALARVAHKYAARFIELTGTPSPNGLKDLWGQLWFLDIGRSLGRAYTAFQKRWFDTGYNGWDMKLLPFAQEQIEDAVAPLCVSLKAEDYFELEEPIINKHYVPMPEKARYTYKEMEQKMFMELEGHEVEAFNAASRTMKCLQLANGAAYVENDNKK